MSRKGSKNLSEGERKLMVAVINDYEVCDLSDQRMIEILSQRLGRSIKESTYYTLKSEAKKNRQTSEQWLDNFCRSGIVDFYKERLDELLLVQRTLMKLYADEANKKDTVIRQNRALLAKLAKAISDNSKNLAEIGIGSPIILAKLQSLIPKELLQGDLEYTEKYFENMDKNQKMLWSGGGGESDEIKDDVENNEKAEIKLDPSKATTALPPPIDDFSSTNNGKSSKESRLENNATDYQDDQRVF